MAPPNVRRVSRRQALRALLAATAGGATALLAACGDPAPPRPVALQPTPTAPPRVTPTPAPSATPRATPTPSPRVPRTPRAGVLTPVAVTSPAPQPTASPSPSPSPTPQPSPTLTAEPTATPVPTPRPRPGPRATAVPPPAELPPPGATALDGAVADPAFAESRIWEHWEAAQAYFARDLDGPGASEFHNAVAIAFAQGRADIGEYLAAESLESIRAAGGAERLAALDLGGRVAGWLPAATKSSLRASANAVYREVMTREALDVAESTVVTLLRQLRTIRDSTGLFGVHWPDPGRTYRDGTPFVERVVSFASPETEYHRERVRVRVARLRERHPDSPIIVRVDYRPGQTIPRTEAERDEYYRQLENIISAPEFQGLILQQGNEPQFDGNPSPDEIAREFNGWGVPETDTGNFWVRCDIFNPTAIRLPMPIAPFHPDGPGQANPSGLEDSPWARMAYQTKRRILETGRARRRVPHAWAEHVYGDPRPDQPGADREAWADQRELGNGFRWGMNVTETWQEINTFLERQFGQSPLPVWVTEFNTAARGIVPPFQPADNYVRGWIIHALAKLTAAFPTLKGACWFVADSYNHDAQWTRFALHEKQGRMPDAERDFQLLQAAGV